MSEDLTNLVSLQYLGVAGNYLGDRGARALVRSVRVLPVFDTVFVRANGISAERVREIRLCPYVGLLLKDLDNQSTHVVANTTGLYNAFEMETL